MAGRLLILLLVALPAFADDCNSLADNIQKELEDQVIDAAEKYADKKYNVKGLVGPLGSYARDMAHAKNDYDRWDAAIDHYFETTKNVLEKIKPGIKQQMKDVLRQFNGDPAGGSGGCGGKGADDAAEASGGAGKRIDPLILDLDGNGIRFVEIHRSRAFFDLSGNGFAVKTAWVEGGDAFLAIDENQDGIVNGISELIGDETEEGFEELARYDDDGDGKISSEEISLAGLTLWLDGNADGMTQPGELVTLESKGITELGIRHATVSRGDDDGRILAKSYFVQNGEKKTLYEIDFLTLPSYSRFVGALDPAAPAIAMEKRVVAEDKGQGFDLRGYGLLPNLAQAMKMHPELEGMARDVFADRDPRRILDAFEAFLFAWAESRGTKLADLDSTPLPNVEITETAVRFPRPKVVMPLDRLGFLRKYAGLKELQIGDGAWLRDHQAQYTGALYADAWAAAHNNLLAKFAVRRGYFDPARYPFGYRVDTDYLYVANPNSAEWTKKVLEDVFSGEPERQSQGLLAQVVLSQMSGVSHRQFAVALFEVVEKKGAQALEKALSHPFMALLAVIRTGGIADDSMEGNADNEILLAGGGNDKLRGNSGDDILSAGYGDDVLDGGAGNDRLEGGRGNDRLTGGPGRDSFLLETGGGVDTVTDACSSKERDRVRLGVEIEKARLTPEGNDLLVEIVGTTDKLVLEGCFQYGNEAASLELELTDGTVIDYEASLEKLPRHYAEAKTDLLFKAISQGSLRKVEIYVAGGIDLNRADESNRTPLLTAVSYGKPEVVKTLLARQTIDPNAADRYGNTALHYAVEGDRAAILEMLLRYPGIDVNKARPDGETPLHRAAARKETGAVEMLLAHAGINTMAADSSGNTPLHWAAQSGRFDNVARLAGASGTRLRAKNRHGDTAYDQARAPEVKKLLVFLGGAPNPYIAATIKAMTTVHAWFEARGKASLSK